MAQNEYAGSAGPYVEAMLTIRRVKNLFFGLLVVTILAMIIAFCLVRYVGVISGQLRGLDGLGLLGPFGLPRADPHPGRA